MLSLLSAVAAPSWAAFLLSHENTQDQSVEGKDQAVLIKSRLQEMVRAGHAVLTGQMKEIEEAANIIRAEATGGPCRVSETIDFYLVRDYIRRACIH